MVNEWSGGICMISSSCKHRPMSFFGELLLSEMYPALFSWTPLLALVGLIVAMVICADGLCYAGGMMRISARVPTQWVVGDS